MKITVNEELRKYIDPLTESERTLLERSLLTEGCRDALVLWGEILIDGHNRYEICQKHGVEFKTIQNSNFETIEQVMLWMIDNQLSRRSVTDFQRGMLALRKKELLESDGHRSQEIQNEAVPEQSSTPTAPTIITKTSRKAVAQIAGVSSHTIGQIEKIQKTATPELINAVRTGTISIGAAAAVASLPSDDQLAAVAGGKKELRQVARQVREAKTPPKPTPVETTDDYASNVSKLSDAAVSPSEVVALREKIAELSAENLSLKEQVSRLTTALESLSETSAG